MTISLSISNEQSFSGEGGRWWRCLTGEKDEALRGWEHGGVETPLWWFCVNRVVNNALNEALSQSELCPRSGYYCAACHAFRRRGGGKVQSCEKCGILKTHPTIWSGFRTVFRLAKIWAHQWSKLICGAVVEIGTLWTTMADEDSWLYGEEGGGEENVSVLLLMHQPLIHLWHIGGRGGIERSRSRGAGWADGGGVSGNHNR